MKNALSYRRRKKRLVILLLLLAAAVGIGLGLNAGGRDADAVSNNDPGGSTPGEDGGDDGNAGIPGQDGPGISDGQDGPSTPDGQGGTGTPDGQDGTDPDSTKPDAAAGYASILNQYDTALKEAWDAERLTEAGFSILARQYCYDGNARENIGFAFLDVNGDGEAELLIGAVAGDAFVERQIFELYTLRDGMPQQVFSGGERSRYYLCEEEDGSFLFANEGSSSAANSEWCYYTLQDGELSAVRTIVYDAVTDPQNPWHTAVGADAAEGRLQEIAEEEARAIIEAYEADYAKIEYSPFTDFHTPEAR